MRKREEEEEEEQMERSCLGDSCLVRCDGETESDKERDEITGGGKQTRQTDGTER